MLQSEVFVLYSGHFSTRPSTHKHRVLFMRYSCVPESAGKPHGHLYGASCIRHTQYVILQWSQSLLDKGPLDWNKEVVIAEIRLCQAVVVKLVVAQWPCRLRARPHTTTVATEGPFSHTVHTELSPKMKYGRLTTRCLRLRWSWQLRTSAALVVRQREAPLTLHCASVKQSTVGPFYRSTHLRWVVSVTWLPQRHLWQLGWGESVKRSQMSSLWAQSN